MSINTVRVCIHRDITRWRKTLKAKSSNCVYPSVVFWGGPILLGPEQTPFTLASKGGKRSQQLARSGPAGASMGMTSSCLYLLSSHPSGMTQITPDSRQRDTFLIVMCEGWRCSAHGAGSAGRCPSPGAGSGSGGEDPGGLEVWLTWAHGWWCEVWGRVLRVSHPGVVSEQLWQGLWCCLY